MAADLLARYRAGEHSEVWRELRQRGGLRDDDREEALAVARATMVRVADGVDRIAERLSQRGWSPPSGFQLRTPPRPEDARVMARIVAITKAPLPVSLEAFWEVVGGVDFAWNLELGDPPDLGPRVAMPEMDPLVIYPLWMVDHSCHEWERDELERGERGDRYDLSLAPDHFHKAGISGGSPYGISLPFWGADPRFEDEIRRLPFVRYLRLCLRWGGFPGLERHSRRPGVSAFVAEVRDGIEPF
jgi:hypothetical protein